jgi:hypothetical protein
MNQAMKETKMKFVVDFGKKAAGDLKAASLLEMSIGELLYRVLLGEDGPLMDKAEGDAV